MLQAPHIRVTGSLDDRDEGVLRVPNPPNGNALPTMTVAQRIVQVLDQLGIEKAHVAAHMPGDWRELIIDHPHRISSLSLVCPELVDVAALRRLADSVLLLYGDQPPYGERLAQAFTQLPAAQQLVLTGYSNMTWNDPVRHWIEVIEPRLLHFLETQHPDGPTRNHDPQDATTGTIAGITYHMQGQGEPLILLPLGLAPSQWDALLPVLQDRFLTITLGGPELGFLPLLEQRGKSAGFQRLLRAMVHELQPTPAATILDVGCGSGVIDRWLASATTGGNPILGVDINPYLLREAAVMVREEALDSIIQFRDGNAEALPFEEAAFDIVISTTVMEEVNATRMLAELVRVTKPGGKIGVIVRALDLPRYSSVSVRPELKLKCETPPPGVSSATGCVSADLYRRFQHAGLEDVRILPDWTVFRDFHGVVEGTLQRIMAANLEPHEVTEWRAAAERAVQDGTFFMTWPHHCAVATKPA
jgi:SAM-dependent methyltransferase